MTHLIESAIGWFSLHQQNPTSHRIMVSPKMKRERKEERKEGKLSENLLTTHQGQYLSYPLEVNLEIRLIRKLNRWDLRNSDLYSCASVFDVTLLAVPQIAQQVQFHLRDGFQGIIYTFCPTLL